jgi:FKBP-type peptidyl-prolyl cis-trans isomerase
MERVSKEGDVLSMNYTGRLEDGTIFDSNVLPEFGHVEPFNFTLGAGQVIAGWDEGLAGMKIGEKKTLTIPPEKGYGQSGAGSIPPNATLIFDVELLDIR